MKRLVIFLLLLACALCAAAQTQVTLTASSPVALAGALVSFTATVSGTPSSAMPTSVIPTGTVTFEDGTTPIGDVTLHTNLGLATGTFFTTSLAAGSHSIIALYSGDANFKAATSAATTIAIEAYSITPSATTLTLTQGQSGNITYTVADGTGVSTTVDFGCVPPPSTYTTCAFSPASRHRERPGRADHRHHRHNHSLRPRLLLPPPRQQRPRPRVVSLPVFSSGIAPAPPFRQTSSFRR